MQNSRFLRKKYAQVILFTIILLITPDSTRGELVVFDLGLNGLASLNGQDLNGLSFGSTSVNGSTFTAIMSAQTQTPSTFRLRARGLGINSPGADRGGQIDDRSVPHEGFDFAFAVSIPANITVVSLDLQAIGGLGNPGQDQALLSFSGGNSFVIDGTTVNGLDQITVNEEHPNGQNISLSHVDGNGFRIQAITLDIQPIPECSTVLMFALAIGWSSRIRRRCFS